MNARNVWMIVAAGLLLGSAFAAKPEDTPPEWAYPVNPPGGAAPSAEALKQIRRVPDSDTSYTLGQAKDFFFAPDWHPEDHPPLPSIVARGRKPNVFACGICHRADGSGGLLCGPDAARKHPCH